jgi:hypothetical protein
MLSRAQAKKTLKLGTNWERSFFVLQAAILIHGLMHFWQILALPSTPELVIWDVRGSFLESVALIFFVSGFVSSITSSFAVDHFELFGLSQGFGVDISQALGLTTPETGKEGEDVSSGPASRTRSQQQATSQESVVTESTNVPLLAKVHFKYVAHPMMAGLLLGLWSTPLMTASRFLFAVCTTIYILTAVRFVEERDLQEKFGEAHKEYLKAASRSMIAPAGAEGSIRVEKSKDS